MKSALQLLDGLADRDVDWIFGAATEQRVAAGAAVTTEGADVDALHLVLQGTFCVRTAATGSMTLGTLGPGDVIGEISFVERVPASASVLALEESLLLVLPHATLDARLEDDPRFDSRLYRAFAAVAAQRLRERVGTLGEHLRDNLSAAPGAPARWTRIEKAMGALKEHVHKADKAALRSGDVPDTLSQLVGTAFKDVCAVLHDELGDASPEHPEIKKELGSRARRELLPYLLLTESAERAYSKPRGYAGDFMTIGLIYRNVPGGTGRVGPIIDRCFLSSPACAAVRSRRRLMADEIQAAVTASGQQTRVTCLASGPADELFDVYARLPDPTRLCSTLVDIDPQAVAFVAARRDVQKLQNLIRTENTNLLLLATGRQTLDLPPQDLVYSMGVLDYLTDKYVLKLLAVAHGLLRPGGKLVVGNFHPRNRAKELMDHVLDWKLVHRTEDDMDRLFRASAFGKPCSRIRFEEERLDLFAECTRDG